nr:Leucine-rich repeat-containing protein 71 [Polyrhizophydium stewartii]
MIADQAISDPEGQQELTGNFEQDYAEACKRLGVKPFAILKFGIPLPPLPYAPAALNESTAAPQGAGTAGTGASPASIQMGGANLNQVEDALYGSTQMLGPSASRNNQLGGKADNKKGSRLDLAASTMRLRPGTAGSHPPITTYTSRYRFRPTIDVETIDNEEEEEVYKIQSHFSVLQSTASSLNIRTLFIDQNPQIPELLYANLLGEESVIKTLSLRGNNLTDAGVKLIAAALKTNRMLTNLNLWDNCITREGAEALAEDANPKKKGRSGRGASAKQAEEKKDDKNKRSSKVPGKKGVESVPSSRPIKTPEDAKNKKQQAQSATSDDKKGKDKKSALASKGGKKMKVEDAKEDADDAGDSLNGIEPMFESNGQWYILGNRMLNSLNLSHNGITAIGLKALLDAVLDQEATNEQTPDGMLGIFRISLQHNPIDLDSPMHQQLQALLNSRNPFFEVLEAEAAADGALGEVAEIAQSESESVPEEAAA